MFVNQPCKYTNQITIKSKTKILNLFNLSYIFSCYLKNDMSNRKIGQMIL